MSSTSAETFGVKLNYEGQMRRFPIAVGTSFKDLREQVLSILSIPKEADVVLKYSDEEGDLITITSDLELSSALVAGNLLRLTVIERQRNALAPGYPILDAPMLDVAQPTAPPAQGEGGETFRSLGGGPVPYPPGFAAHPHPPPPHMHPHPPPPHMHPHPPHEGGPAWGPYRGGLGFQRGGRGHHGGRGGWGHHRGGFHGHGPYGHCRKEDMTPEEWQQLKKERKAMKEMRKEWKEGHKHMKKEWKEGCGRGGRFRCADGMQWGWGNPGAQEVVNLAKDDDRLVARFAKDVTVPDGTQIAPNTPFIKTWRLRNEGAAWPAGCMLRFLGKKSDKMGSAETVPLPIEGIVAPNAEIDVSVNLVAPSKPGRYTGYWKMTTPEGRKFGQRVWASIVVPGSPGSSSSSSSSDSDREADRYEAMVDTVLATGLKAKRHRVFRMLQKTKGDVNLVCEKLAKKQEKKARKAMKKQMKI